MAFLKGPKPAARRCGGSAACRQASQLATAMITTQANPGHPRRA
jgi:hypothetical protein